MQCSNKQEVHLTILRKLIDISFSCTCPAIDKEICHNIVQVAADPLSYCLVDSQLL